jgi:Sulfotransferase family
MTASGGSPPTVASRIGEIVHAAKTDTGLDDLGSDSWREGLEVIVGSAMTEATLNDYGEEAFHASLVRPLVNRLKVEDWYRRHPEIDEQEVSIELLGVGFPRTGSTALSHMLAEDPLFRTLRIWEETDPCPPPGLDPEADDARMAAARMTVELGRDHSAARLRSMLPQSATGPMEDHDLMALEFKAQHFLVSARLPTYAQWFVNCDMEPTYRYEKRVLKLLQWKTGQKVWRLKSPTHTMFLEAYESVFPDARFVQTHRDISKVIGSVCDLYFAMLQMGNPDIDPLYVGELNMAQWGIALDRMLAFRQDPERDAKFFDIGFTRFQADPLNEISGLYDWLGDELTEDTTGQMLAWRADNPKDKYGKHTYDAGQFGVTDASLAERFGAYRARFGPLLD